MKPNRTLRNLLALIVLFLLPTPTRAEDLSHLARNDAVALTVSGFRLADRYGPLQPTEGHKFLILATEWRNQLGATVIDGKLMPTPYVVPQLDQQLFLIVNGAKVAPLAPTEGRPGLLPNKDFKVPNPTTPVNGNLVYDVPADAKDLLLVFIDEKYGVMFLPLAGEPAAAPAKTEKNQLVEAYVANQRVVEDPATPPGMQTIAVDVRFRSLFKPDPRAKAGKVVSLPDWQGKYVQAVSDSVYAATLVSGPFDAGAKILPEVALGGEFVFRVPSQRNTLALSFYFGELPVGTTRLRPRALTFPLTLPAEPATEPRRTNLLSTRDGIFEIAVNDVSTVDQFAGVKPADGKRFLLLDTTVSNYSRQPEFFQTAEQLKHVGADGQSAAPDDATYKGPHGPQPLMLIPDGQKRSFQLVYLIPNDQAKARLAYASPTPKGSKVFDLPPLPATISAAATTSPPPVKGSTFAGAMANAANADNPATSTTPPIDTRTAEVPNNPFKTGKPVRVAAHQDIQPRGLAGVGLTPEQVNSSIDRGAKALWDLVKAEDLKSGKFGDKPEHSLVALALVHADAHRKIPEFNAVLRQYLTKVEPRKLGVYRAGLTAMLVEAYGDSSFSPKLEEATRYLIEGQGPKGTWVYTPLVQDALFVKPPEAPSVINVSGGVPLDKPAEPWKRMSKPGNTDGDNSVTQYALLGLNAASRSGVKAAPEIWQSSLDTARQRQNKNGGWGYTDKNSGTYGSMTAAGICAVALCRYELGEADPANDAAIENGLGWLSANFSVAKHPGSEKWLYYYLYSLERVGRVLDTEFIGPHEWYPLGARQLLVNQKGSGLWIDQLEEKDPRLPTSFALLFLTRATPSLKLTHEQGPGTLVARASAPVQKFYIILDASGSMIDTMDGRMKFDIARDSVRSLIENLPPNSAVALRVYGHRKNSLQPGADEDTELKIPMGLLDKSKFNATLDALRSRGKTPLALSIQLAIKDLARVGEADPVTLLLLTDGGEDTIKPRGNPVNAARELAGLKGVRFHIVGFDINQPEWSEQLQTMASVSGGHYWPAARAADLERGLKNAVLGIPEQYAVVDADGHEVARNAFDVSATLPAGKYKFQTMFAGQTFEREFWINAGHTTSIRFDAALAPSSAPATAPRSTPASAPPASAPPAMTAAPHFCTHCGAPLPAGAKFCPKCGTPVPH